MLGWCDEGQQVIGCSSDLECGGAGAGKTEQGGCGTPGAGLPASVRILALTLCKLDEASWRALPTEGRDLASDSCLVIPVAVWRPHQGRLPDWEGS